MISGQYRLLLLLALILEAAYLGMLSLGSLGEQVVEFIALFLLASSLYLGCCYLITRERGDGSSNGALRALGTDSRKLLLLIWAAGIVFPVTLLPLDPTLSEDLNRYRWHGKLQAAGGNPYVEIPAHPRWESLRAPTWSRVDRQDQPSGYGPMRGLA
jgi:hypothetical protein